MPGLKGLSQYNKFDLNGFLAGKKLVLTSVSEWRDYQLKELMGMKVEVTITEDNTSYKVNGNLPISNLYNKLTIKVPSKVDLPIGTEVEIVDGEATVYGDYRNQLSIKAKAARPVTPSTANGGGRS